MIEKIVEIDELSVLVSALNDLDSSYLYRGHSNSSWKLETAFERVYKNRFEQTNNYSIEQYLISEFKSKFHLYDKEGNLIPTSELGWLSLMQHYGVPTRLLDFTLSPYVALYFALENFDTSSTQSFSIVALNWKIIQRLSTNTIKSKYPDFNDDNFYVYRNSEVIYDKYLKDDDINIVWFSEPTVLNRRLDLQKGSFLFSSNPGIKLNRILQSSKYSVVDKIEYIINPKLFKACYSLLEKMNINSKIIYGDLNGLGISIKNELKSMSLG